MICKECNTETEATEFSYIINKFPFMYSTTEITVGISNNRLCPDCKVQADIELRDFIKQSKYYKELSLF